MIDSSLGMHLRVENCLKGTEGKASRVRPAWSSINDSAKSEYSTKLRASAHTNLSGPRWSCCFKKLHNSSKGTLFMKALPLDL